MFFKFKRNITELECTPVLKNFMLNSSMDNKMQALSVIYSSLINDFPEISIDENSGIIDFKRKTDSNLTIFTITINGEKLSLSYNDKGLISSSDTAFKPDEDILSEIQKSIMKLNFYQILEFYEGHDNITWKHEIYKYDR